MDFNFLRPAKGKQERTSNERHKDSGQDEVGSLPATPEEAAERYWEARLRHKNENGEAVLINQDAINTYFHGRYADNMYKLYSPASLLLFQRALANNTNPTVVFTGGGPGAGKSELVAKRILESDFDGVIFDSNFSVYERVVGQIAAVRAVGRKPFVCGVLPDLESARKFTIERSKTTGRSVQDRSFAFGHANFPKVLQRVLLEGHLNKDEALLFDFRSARNMEDIKRIISATNYPQEELLSILESVAYDEKEIETRYAEHTYKGSD